MKDGVEIAVQSINLFSGDVVIVLMLMLLMNLYCIYIEIIKETCSELQNTLFVLGTWEPMNCFTK